MKNTTAAIILFTLLFCACRKKENPTVKPPTKDSTATNDSLPTPVIPKFDTSIYSGTATFSGYNNLYQSDSSYTALFYVLKSVDSIYISATLYQLLDNDSPNYVPYNINWGFIRNDSGVYNYHLRHYINDFQFKPDSNTLVVELQREVGGLEYQSDIQYTGTRIK